MVFPVPSGRIVAGVRVLEENMGAVRTKSNAQLVRLRSIDRVQRRYLRKFAAKGEIVVSDAEADYQYAEFVTTRKSHRSQMSNSLTEVLH